MSKSIKLSSGSQSVIPVGDDGKKPFVEFIRQRITSATFELLAGQSKQISIPYIVPSGYELISVISVSPDTHIGIAYLYNINAVSSVLECWTRNVGTSTLPAASVSAMVLFGKRAT